MSDHSDRHGPLSNWRRTRLSEPPKDRFSAPLCLLLAGLAFGGGCSQSEPVSSPGEGAVQRLLQTTKDLHPEGSAAIIDLDALGRNIARVRATLGDRYALRWVAKSLPSPHLLEWLGKHGGSQRFMVFQAEMLAELLTSVPTADVLLGKPIPVKTAEAFLRQRPSGAHTIRWLIDTPERLRGYEILAHQLGTTLQVALEIDVGLRRGGFNADHSFSAALALIKASQSSVHGLRLGGLMGYDGHVPHADPLLGPGKERAAAREFAHVQRRYAAFVALVKEVDPSWLKAPLFDGGGSRTYWRYRGAQTPINEIALGSALLKPTHFDDLPLAELEPASYLLIPILKKVHYPFPFIPPLWPWVARLFPDAEFGFYLYGSTWGGQVLWPHGLKEAWFHPRGIQNLYPNQQLLMGPRTVRAEVGERVLVRPPEGDTLTAFDQIFAIEHGAPPLHWHPMRNRN